MLQSGMILERVTIQLLILSLRRLSTDWMLPKKKKHQDFKIQKVNQQFSLFLFQNGKGKIIFLKNQTFICRICSVSDCTNSWPAQQQPLVDSSLIYCYSIIVFWQSFVVSVGLNNILHIETTQYHAAVWWNQKATRIDTNSPSLCCALLLSSLGVRGPSIFLQTERK